MELSQVKKNIDKLKNLTNKETVIRDIDINYDFLIYEEIFIPDPFFENLWNSDCDNLLIEFLCYAGVHWNNYIYDTFLPYFKNIQTEYFICKTLQKFPKTIQAYFSNHTEELFSPKFSEYPKTWKSIFRELPFNAIDVSKEFYYELSDFLSAKAKFCIKNKKVQIKDRVRYSLATNEEFLDSRQGNSISYFNRRIKNWDIQNYNIYFSKYDFEDFNRLGDDNEVKKSIEQFKQIVDLLGYIPNQNLTGYQIYSTVSKKKFIKISRLMKKTFYPCRYIDIYGTWLNFLKAAKILDANVQKKTFGYQVLAKDGHKCNSLIEKNIDDFFFDNNIEHFKEVLYPESARIITKKNFKADWKIEDTYIEYFGLSEYKPYKETMALKISVCEFLNIKLIPLYPGDEFNLQFIFSKYLNADN